MGDIDQTLEAFEQALAHVGEERYHLRLFVTGATPRSSRAIANARRILDTYLPGRYELEVIDIFQEPQAAEGLMVIAAPTLVKTLPPPLKRMIGDLSDEERVLLGLGLSLPTDEEVD
jgi:circadian clock protein KaiB